MINSINYRYAMGMAVAVVLGSAAEVSGAVPTFSNTAGLAYSQDFNTLASTGTANAWANDSTLGGWYAQSAVNNPTFWNSDYRADNGSANNGDLYSYGATSSSERALGTYPRDPASTANDTGTFYIGLQLQNISGITLDQLQVIYGAEHWRDGKNGDSTLSFSYQISSTALTSLTTGTWTAATSLDFSTTETQSSSAGALNGNSVGALKNALIGAVALGLQNNYYIMLRWANPAAANQNHGIAVDNVFVAVPEAGTWSAGALLGAAAFVGYRRSRRTVA